MESQKQAVSRGYRASLCGPVLEETGQKERKAHQQTGRVCDEARLVIER